MMISDLLCMSWMTLIEFIGKNSTIVWVIGINDNYESFDRMHYIDSVQVLMQEIGCQYLHD